MNKVKKPEFTIDWKYSAEVIIWNVGNIVKNFPVKFIEERQEYGDWYEIVECEGKEFKLKVDPENSYGGLEKIMDFVNAHLPDKRTRFILLPDDGDSYSYKLERF